MTGIPLALNRRINFPVATGSQIAVGSFSGQVQIWDAAQSTFLREMKSHTSRVGTLAWSSSMLASGVNMLVTKPIHLANATWHYMNV